MNEADVARIVAESLRRLAPAITGIGVLLLCLELLIGAAAPPWRTVLIIAGIALAGGSWLVDLLRDRKGRRRSILAVVVGVSVFFLVLGYILRPVGERLNDTLLVDCADPVELSVVVPVDGAAGFQESIAEFNERYTDKDRCRRANVTSYSAPWPAVEQAMRLGWEHVEDTEDAEDGALFDPLRDVGPRPHLWIAESRTQVDLAAEALDGSDVDYEVFAPDDAEPIGLTPLVLAVPTGVLGEGFNGGSPIADRTLPELITELGDVHGTPVLRSDPEATHAGLLFLRALYGRDAAPGGTGARMENRLADAAAETGIALSPSDTDLLCDLSTAQGSIPTAAVLTTEAALARSNTGGSLGDECAIGGDAPPALVPVYSPELGALDYQAVGLDWNDDAWAERRAAVAEDLRTWLADGDDGWSPADMGLRDVRYAGGAIAGDEGFEHGFAAEADPMSADELTALRDVYSRNRVPTDVLLAIDRSATMNEPVGGGASRFELAAQGAVAALDYLGAEDRVGVWTFPAEGSDSHTPVLDIGPDPGGGVAEALEDTEVSHGVDLHQTVVDGIAALEAAREGERLSAMVVLTDGADADDSPTTAAAVRDRLADSQVRLYLIAVGEASCRSASFSALAEDSRVTCFEAAEQQITITFDGLFSQLWSGDA
nr:vWA domain-containing protein [Glycomyces amatae]